MLRLAEDVGVLNEWAARRAGRWSYWRCRNMELSNVSLFADEALVATCTAATPDEAIHAAASKVASE
jgi:hypothetical protein